MSHNNFLKKLLLFTGLIVISQLSLAGYTGSVVPSNPEEKRYGCTKSYGCTATGKISYWDYMYYRYGPKGPYKSRKYTQFKVMGKCTLNYKGKYMWFAGTSASQLSDWNKKYCKGPAIKDAPRPGGSGGSGGSAPIAAFACPNTHKDGTTVVSYASPHQLCCNPLHSTNPGSNLNTHPP